MTQPVFITSINFLTIFEISNSFENQLLRKNGTHTHTNEHIGFWLQIQNLIQDPHHLTQLFIQLKSVLLKC